MNFGWPLLVLFAVIVVVLGILRRRPKSRTSDEGGMFMPRVEGFQVMSPLHPRMTRGCVFDSGLQYGHGFRRKEGPALPHGPDCKCRTAPFAFSGSEVFGGSLRKIAEIRCAVPDFPQEACKPLFDALKRVNAEPVPDTLTGYLEQVGAIDGLAPEHQEPVRRFLEDRFAYLRNLSANQSGGGKTAESPVSQPTDGG